MNRLSIVLCCAALAGCIGVTPPDGDYSCSPTGQACPDGYECVTELNACYRVGHHPDLGMPVGDLGKPVTVVDMTPPPATCSDGVKNALETDIDCGGPSCSACAANKSCAENRDCVTGSCIKQFCQLVSDSPKWISNGVPPMGPTTGADAVYAARSGFGAVVTSGGNFLVMGGIFNSNTVTNYISDYKPGTGFVQPWPAMPNPRWSFASAYGPDGRVYTLGGWYQDSSSTIHTWDVVDALDLNTNTWNSPAVASLKRKVYGNGAAFSAGKLYAIAGIEFATGTMGVTQVYSPGSPGSWTDLTTTNPMPTPRRTSGVATGPDGRVYAIGGLDASGNRTPSVESISPADNTWITSANISAPRAEIAVIAAPDGRLYVIGGTDAAGNPTAIVEAYTPATDTWTPVAKLNVARGYGTALIGNDNRIYFLGGNTTSSNSPTNLVEVYGPTIDVSPKVGTKGLTNVSVTGSNFAANATVNIYFGAPTGAPIASGMTDANGAISTAITAKVPASAQTGAAKIYAVDTLSQYPAPAAFTVN